MDLDRSCLELMIRLLEMEQDDSVDDQLTAKEMSKVKEKIRKLCETVHNKHLDLENITVSGSHVSESKPQMKEKDTCIFLFCLPDGTFSDGDASVSDVKASWRLV